MTALTLQCTSTPGGRRLSPAAAAVGAANVLVVVAGLQVALALGAPYGEHVHGGRAPIVDGVLADPYRVASGAAAGALCLAAWVLLRRVALVGRGAPGPAVQRAAWVVAVWAGCNTVLNLVSSSPVERWLLGAGMALVALLAAQVARSPVAGPD